MLVELVLIFVVKNDIETLFSGNRLQNQGSHYIQVRIIHG